MKLYLAPMEGITGFIYRNTYNRYFGQIDKYFTPFISPGEHRSYKSKELKDVLPENNQGMKVAVQPLTNNAGDFVYTAKRLYEMGHTEVNLNLGCPSKTVVTKAKGAGFLAFPERLDAFFSEIFEGLSKSGIRISVKTRLGMEKPEEFDRLLEIYKKYPFCELIIHPRVQRQFYSGEPDKTAFFKAVREYGECAPDTRIVYNGDLFTKGDHDRFVREFPKADAVMLGRGVIANPGLAGYIKNGTVTEKPRLKAFYEELAARYREEIRDERNTMYKLKELWFYMVHSFTEPEEYVRLIKRAGNLMELNIAVNRLFKEQEIDMDRGFCMKY